MAVQEKKAHMLTKVEY